MCAFHEVFAHLLHALSDCEVVMPRSDDQIGPENRTVFVDLVMVNQGSAWGFDNSYPRQRIYLSVGASVLVQNLRLCKQSLHSFQGVDYFDKPRIMVEKSAVRHATKALTKFAQLRIRHWSATLVRHIDTRQRTHPVNAF